MKGVRKFQNTFLSSSYSDYADFGQHICSKGEERDDGTLYPDQRIVSWTTNRSFGVVRKEDVVNWQRQVTVEAK